MSQLVLFPEIEEQDSEVIPVVKKNFVECNDLSWKDLFSGFNRLYAITFSYGLDFIEKVIKNYDSAEIILGCEALVKFDLQTIMAHQSKSIASIGNHLDLVERVKDEKLKFWVSKEILSHEKVYILEADDGRTRVITGSANFSSRAFNGKQAENIEYYDNDEKAYLYFINVFATLKSLSCNEIAKETLYTNIDNEENIFEEIPILKEAKVSKAGVIIDEAKIEREEVEYVFDISELSKKYKNVLPKPDKKGKIILNPSKTTTMIQNYKKLVKEEKERIKMYPQFKIDYEKFKVTFNGNEYNLKPNIDDVEKDIKCLLEYFDGFDNFVADTNVLKEKYFQIANYLFLSPFIAKLRYEAYMNDFPVRVFPIYAVLCGKSDAGKSEFIATIHSMMFGKSLGKNSPEIFTPSRVSSVLNEVTGVPILIDDITNDRFRKYCGEVVKYDEDLLIKRNINHPTFILTSNDIKSIKPEYSKRVVVNYVEGNLPKLVATSSHKKITEIRKSLTTNFYSEYLSRMQYKVQELIKKMNTYDTKFSEADWFPDIFMISSQTVIEIINDCGIEVPTFIHVLKYNDYFGDNALGIRVYNQVRRDWEHNKSAFEIQRKRNVLIYQPGEKSYEAEWVYNELPAVLNADHVATKVIMNLKEAEKFFDIRFKKSIFER